jgi:Tol biopolymer transport system component
MWRVSLLVAIVLMPSALVGRQQESAEVQLKAAMHRELVDGDLRAAIKEYEAILSRHSSNRGVAARALLQLGQCYEKLGQTDARAAYERLVRDYADQVEMVAQARGRLATFSRNEPAASQPVSVPVAAVRPLPRVDIVNDLQALSPDGSKALFIRYDNGQNLAVYDFVTGESKSLTAFDWVTAWVNHAAWSPDGRRVAYTQTPGPPDSVSEIRVTTLAGESRAIFRNDANPGRGVRPVDWLPDGRTLVAVLERADGTFAIGLIPAGGGPFTPLRSLQWAAGRPDRPRLSPDGRFVAFAEGATGMRDIHVLSLDVLTAFRITDHPADDRQPLWSPDGRHLVFTSERFGSAALWAVAVRNGQAVGEPARIKDAMHDTKLIDWTTRGLTYMQHLRTSDIYTVSLDRETRRPGGRPEQLSYPRTGRNSGPVWSPDGRDLAFVSGSPAEPDRRYVVLLSEGGAQPREFLIPTTRYSNPQEPYDLRWFGDGSGLGFSSTDAQGQPAVFQLSLASGQWKTFPSPLKTWTRIEWNADGTRYFYTRPPSSGTTPGIIERDVTTNQERVVFEDVTTSSVLRALRFGPDRRSLAFTASSVEGGQTTVRLLLADTEAGQARVLVDENSGMTLETSVVLGVPAWLPDGRSLLVPRSAGTNWPELRVVPLDGGRSSVLPLDPSFARQAAMGADNNLAPAIREVVLSPDGARLAFVLSASRLDTWVMENVLAGVAPATAAPRR